LQAFKVLLPDMTSPGLLGAKRIGYRLGSRVKAKGLRSANPHGGGKLHVARTEQDARGLAGYLRRAYKIKARIFLCEIGAVIDITSGKITTDRVRLLKEV